MKFMAPLFATGCAILATACSPESATPAVPSPAASSQPTVEDDAVACEACFPVESLTEEARAKAEAVLLAALDGEALYTLLSDMKPMSSGFSGLTFPSSSRTVPELDTLRSILKVFACTPRL